MRIPGWIMIVAATATLAQPLAAQAPDTAASIRLSGVVSEYGTETVIAGARVAISPADGTGPPAATTDEGGHFTFPPLPAGAYSLEVQQPGYQTIRDSIAVEEHHDYRLRVEIVPDTMERLAVVEVMPWRISSRIGEFHRRRQSGWGTYFTREDIERIQPNLITDLLRRVPGVRIDPIISGVANDVTMQGGCRPALFVDDLYMRGMLGSDIDRQLSPDETEGIEVYRGNTAPGKLARNACGTLAIWSRTFDPGTPDRPPLTRLLITGVVVGAGLLFSGVFF